MDDRWKIKGEPARWQTVGELIKDLARRLPDRIGFEIVGRTMTYGELDAVSDRVAAGLVALGVDKGDRVAGLMFNRSEQLFLWGGAAKIGAIWVPLNPGLVGDDLVNTLNDASPRVLVTDSGGRDKVLAVAGRIVCAEHRYVTEMPADDGFRPFDDLVMDGAEAPARSMEPSDPALIVYTGGTTGLPKGVVLSHFSCICSGYRYREAFRVEPSDKNFTVLSLAHVGGLGFGFLGPMVCGIPSVVERRFSVSNYWPRVRETGSTIIDIIGTMMTMLVQQPESPEDRNHNVRVSLGAVGQLPQDIPDAFQRRFGIQLVGAYSLSESGGILTVNNPIGSPKPHSCGKAWGWADVRIADQHDQALAPGEIGEILMRPQVASTFMSGYYRNLEQTLESFRNMWLHTGDNGYIDEEGWLYFVGRQAHWLRRRGENISAYEVESILSQYQGIAEVIVVGVPSELGEEDVKAFIRPAGSAHIDPAELVSWARTRMAQFKVPRFIEIVEDFPRSVTKNEVERHKLRDRSNAASWDMEQMTDDRPKKASG